MAEKKPEKKKVYWLGTTERNDDWLKYVDDGERQREDLEIHRIIQEQHDKKKP
jgi:hypothetical protein